MTRSSSATAAVGTQVGRVLPALLRTSGFALAFGGPADQDESGFRISHTLATHTNSLLRLRVARGEGLGGQALALRKPTLVQDYRQASSVTRRYDAAVAPEGVRTALALPLRSAGKTRAVVYVATRTTVEVGDRFLDRLLPIVRTTERDLVIEEEVQRRVTALSRLRAALPADALTELEQISRTVREPGPRARLEALCAHLSAAGPDRPASSPVQLAPRESEVLWHAELGRTNKEIAEELGLLPNTVKAYLKSAMRKLGAANRTQAVRLARQAGVLA